MAWWQGATTPAVLVKDVAVPTTNVDCLYDGCFVQHVVSEGVGVLAGGGDSHTEASSFASNGMRFVPTQSVYLVRMRKRWLSRASGVDLPFA